VFLSEISPADVVSLHTRTYLDLLQYVGNIDTVIICVTTLSSLVGGWLLTFSKEYTASCSRELNFSGNLAVLTCQLVPKIRRIFLLVALECKVG
jgi:hypothetical protein